MAEDFLEEIYAESILLTKLKQIVEKIRFCSSPTLIGNLNEILPRIGEACKKYTEMDAKKGIELWDSLERVTQYGGNKVWLADWLEGIIIPQYMGYLERLGGIDVDDENGLRLLSSQSGFISLQMTESGKYVNSMIDPMWEAFILAKKMFHPKRKQYIIVGAGMGYLPYQLYLYSEESAQIHIFEPNSKLVEYGKKYGVLDWIPSDNLEITVTNDFLPVLEAASEDGSELYVQSELASLIRDDQKKAVSIVLMGEEIKSGFENKRLVNFFSNIKNVKKTIEDYDSSLLKREMIVVAAGPSVDDRLEYLKEMQGKKTIIAVGTIFSKLVDAGIRPDAVAFLDPTKDIMNQIKGREKETVPLFIGVEAYRGIAEKYEGDKYLVFMEDDDRFLEDYGGSFFRDVVYLQCGTTVTNLANRMAIFWKADRIELIGADFAYPGNVKHAKGVGQFREIDTSGYLKVMDVNGNEICTDGAFNMFREELETMIKENPQIKFYNYSTCGARIKGTLPAPED